MELLNGSGSIFLFLLIIFKQSSSESWRKQVPMETQHLYCRLRNTLNFFHNNRQDIPARFREFSSKWNPSYLILDMYIPQINTSFSQCASVCRGPAEDCKFVYFNQSRFFVTTSYGIRLEKSEVTCTGSNTVFDIARSFVYFSERDSSKQLSNSSAPLQREQGRTSFMVSSTYSRNINQKKLIVRCVLAFKNAAVEHNNQTLYSNRMETVGGVLLLFLAIVTGLTFFFYVVLLAHDIIYHQNEDEAEIDVHMDLDDEVLETYV